MLRRLRVNTEATPGFIARAVWMGPAWGLRRPYQYDSPGILSPERLLLSKFDVRTGKFGVF